MSHITADDLQRWVTLHWPEKLSFETGAVTPTENRKIPTLFLNSTNGSMSLYSAGKWNQLGSNTSFGKMFVLVDGFINIRKDLTLKENDDFSLGVNMAEIDVMKLKNISLLSKGNFRGAITPDPVSLKDAKKGDWWKATTQVVLLSNTFNPGDEMYCTVDIVGIPTDFTKFSIVPETSANMVGASSTIAGTSGKVPGPAAGDEDKVLYGDGKWRPSGGAEIHNPVKKYIKGSYAMYRGLLVQAVEAIPENTAFQWGTTGATWALVSSRTWKGVFAVGTTYDPNDLVALSAATWTDFYYTVSGVTNETKSPAVADGWFAYFGAAVEPKTFSRTLQTEKAGQGLVPSAGTTVPTNNVLSSTGAWVDPLVMTDKNTSKKWKLIVEDGKPYLTDEL